MRPLLTPLSLLLCVGVMGCNEDKAENTREAKLHHYHEMNKLTMAAMDKKDMYIDSMIKYQGQKQFSAFRDSSIKYVGIFGFLIKNNPYPATH